MRLNRKLVAVLAGAAAMSVPALVWAAPTITEFRTGMISNAQPRDIVAGPDGNLWFTEQGDRGGGGDGKRGRIGRITPGGAITEFSSGLDDKAEPYNITAGPDGKIWFTDQDQSRIGRITPAGAITEFDLNGNRKPRDIVPGPDGNLWFTDIEGPGRIGRITPAGVLTEFSAGLTSNSAPWGIAAGPDGNLWFTENANPGRIGRITPAGVITEFKAGLTPNSKPDGIVTGPDGNLWFTENADPGRIGRITPAGVITEFAAGLTPNSRPSGIAAGADDALWFTEEANPGRIGRITTGGAITEHTAGATPNATPVAIAAGPEGNMWFVENTDPGRVGRISVAPGVTGLGASSVTQTTATLGATVGANAQATSFVVQYGTTTAYASKTAPVSAGSAGTRQVVSATVDGLDPGTTYHFRIVATNGAGSTAGPDGGFTTGGVAPPPPKPAMGKSVVAGVVSGTVTVRPPGSARFVPLDGADAVPVGTTLDTRHGVVAVTSALPSGATQSARFWAGVFQVRQARRGNGVANIFLRGGPTRAACARTAHTNALEQATGRRRAARLWGKDRHGRYQTHGGNSVAAVRGTTWLTEERCTGTFTRVTAGAVAVRDLRTHRGVMVRAGRSYLARRPG